MGRTKMSVVDGSDGLELLGVVLKSWCQSGWYTGASWCAADTRERLLSRDLSRVGPIRAVNASRLVALDRAGAKFDNGHLVAQPDKVAA